MASLIYDSARAKLLDGSIDLDTDTIKVALVTSSYSPSQTAHDFFDDVTNEVTGTNYTAGGASLASKTVTADTTNHRGVFDAADTAWASASIANIRGAVIYKSTGTAATSALIAYVDFGADYNVINGTFTITWNTSGILYIG